MYLMQALWPWHRDAVALRRRHEAERQLLRRGAVPLPVEVHLPAKVAAPPRILARHPIHLLHRARLDHHRLLPLVVARHRSARRRVEEGKDALSVAGVGAGEGPAAGGGERVAEGGEDEEEEDSHETEEEEDGEVQEGPLSVGPSRPARR